MKKLIYSMLGGTMAFILSTFLVSNLSRNTALIISLLSFLIGPFITGKLVGKQLKKSLEVVLLEIFGKQLFGYYQSQ